MAKQACTKALALGHDYTGHNYTGHNYTGHNYIGHNYTDHSYVRWRSRHAQGLQLHVTKNVSVFV